MEWGLVKSTQIWITCFCPKHKHLWTKIQISACTYVCTLRTYTYVVHTCSANWCSVVTRCMIRLHSKGSKILCNRYSMAGSHTVMSPRARGCISQIAHAICNFLHNERKNSFKGTLLQARLPLTDWFTELIRIPAWLNTMRLMVRDSMSAGWLAMSTWLVGCRRVFSPL